MIGKQAFEKWYSALPVPYKEDFMNTPALGEWAAKGFNAGYQHAVKHCKQGEKKPVAKVIHDGSYNGIMHVRITNYQALQHGMDLFAHAMPKSDSDPYRAKAVEILELDMEEFGDDKAINLTGLWKLLCGDDGYLAIPNDQYFSVIESTPQPSTDVSELRKQVEMVRDLKKTQCTPGNYNYSPYMLGMANALILAMSVFDGGRPEYLDAPKVWGEDLPMPEKSELDGGTHSSPSTP